MHNDSDPCLNERRNRTTRDFEDPAWNTYEDNIFCSLNDSAMTHLLRRLDRGLEQV